MRRLVPLLVICFALAACPETNERSGEDTGFVGIDANLVTADAARERRDAFVREGVDAAFMERVDAAVLPGEDTNVVVVDAAFPPGEDAFFTAPDGFIP